MIYIKALITTTVLIFTLTGCVSKDTKQLLSNYATASNQAQKSIASTYEDTLNNLDRAKYYKAVRDGAEVPELRLASINYSGQMKTLNELVSFSEAMTVLTGDSFSNKIDENSVKLYESVKSLSENEAISSDVSDKDFQMFTILINGAFKSYSEWYRAKKLKELVLVADKWVQPSIDSLNKGLVRWRDTLEISIIKQQSIKLETLNNPYTYCQAKNKAKKCIPLAENFETKADMYRDIALLQKRLDNLDKEFKALSDSITIMSKLHKSVIKSLKRDEINKEELSRIYYDLKEQVDSVNEFRKTIKGDS